MVKQAHRQGLGKLVPLQLVDTTPGSAASGEVRLRCAMAEFGLLDDAEATYFFPGNEDYEIYGGEPMVSWPYCVPREPWRRACQASRGGRAGRHRRRRAG